MTPQDAITKAKLESVVGWIKAQKHLGDEPLMGSAVDANATLRDSLQGFRHAENRILVNATVLVEPLELCIDRLKLLRLLLPPSEGCLESELLEKCHGFDFMILT